MPKPLNKIAKQDRQCIRCAGTIRKGEQFHGYRERAMSHREAMHASTTHPWRRICAACCAAS